MTAPDRDLERLLEEWRTRWLVDVREDVYRALQNRTIWKSIRDGMISLGDDTDGTWFQTFTWNYVDAQTMFVRRHARPQSDGGERGLGRLLTAVAKNHRAILRAEWVDLCLGAHLSATDRHLVLSWVDGEFTEHLGDSDCLDPAVPTAWRDAMVRDCERVSDLATRQVAHMERHRVRDADPVSFDDLDTAIDRVAQVFTWTNWLLTANTVLLPPIVLPAWAEPLRRGIPVVPQHDGPSEYGPPPIRPAVRIQGNAFGDSGEP